MIDLTHYVKDGQWQVTTEKEKREFYSTGATLTSPPKWDIIIKEHPTDFTDFRTLKPKRWQWARIRAEYAKVYPNITEDQVRSHMKKMKVTIDHPVFAEVPELEHYPNDFSSAINGRAWDRNVVAELYQPYGVPKHEAIAHFNGHVLKQISMKNPVIGAEVWKIPGHLFADGVRGEWLIYPTGKRDPAALEAKRQPPNKFVAYLLSHYNREEVFYWAWENLGIAVFT